MLGRLQKLLRNVEAVLQGELAHLLQGSGGRTRPGAIVHGDPLNLANAEARTKVRIPLPRGEHLQSFLLSHQSLVATTFTPQTNYKNGKFEPHQKSSLKLLPPGQRTKW